MIHSPLGECVGGMIITGAKVPSKLDMSDLPRKVFRFLQLCPGLSCVLVCGGVSLCVRFAPVFAARQAGQQVVRMS